MLDLPRPALSDLGPLLGQQDARAFVPLVRPVPDESERAHGDDVAERVWERKGEFGGFFFFIERIMGNLLDMRGRFSMPSWPNLAARPKREKPMMLVSRPDMG